MVFYCTLSDPLNNIGISDNCCHGIQIWSYMLKHSMLDFIYISEKALKFIVRCK